MLMMRLVCLPLLVFLFLPGLRLPAFAVPFTDTVSVDSASRPLKHETASSPKTIEYYEQLLRLKSNDELQAAAVGIEFGRHLLEKGLPKEALLQLLPAEAFYRKTGDAAGLAKSQALLASFYERYGLWDESERLYRKAVSFYGDFPDSTETVEVIKKLCAVLIKQEKFREALKYCRQARDLYHRMPLPDSIPVLWLKQAYISRKLKNYVTTESLILRQALPLFRSVGNEHGRIGCFHNLAQSYLARKRFSEAKWFFIQENMLALKLRDTSAIINSLIQLARVKIAIGDYVLALKDLKEARTWALRKGDIQCLAGVNEGLAVVYRVMGSKKLSRTARDKAAALNDSLNKLDQSERLKGINTMAEAKKILAARLAKPARDSFVKKAERGDTQYFKYILVTGIALLVLMLSYVLFRKR